MIKDDDFVSEYCVQFDLISICDVLYKLDVIKKKLFNNFCCDLFPYKNLEYSDFVSKCKKLISCFPLYTYLASYKLDFDYRTEDDRGFIQIQLDDEKTQANIDSCFKAFINN